MNINPHLPLQNVENITLLASKMGYSTLLQPIILQKDVSFTKR